MTKPTQAEKTRALAEWMGGGQVNANFAAPDEEAIVGVFWDIPGHDSLLADWDPFVYHADAADVEAWIRRQGKQLRDSYEFHLSWLASPEGDTFDITTASPANRAAAAWRVMQEQAR